MPPYSSAAVLVCAPRDGKDPDVVLADGSYETPDGERVFWRETPDAEVLRLPPHAPVSVTPLRTHTSTEPPHGEDQLLASVARHRPALRPLRLVTPAATLEGPDAMNHHLDQALTEGNVLFAEVLLRLLVRQEGIDAAHRALAQCLEAAGEAWDNGAGVLQERRKARTVRALLERTFPYSRSQTTRGTVLLAVPEDDQHTLALLALAHRFAFAGWYALILDDVPPAELARHAATEQAAAVVVSAHMPLTSAKARRLITALREESPQTLIAFGGPGVRPSIRGADLLTDDVSQVLQLLDHRTSGLTERETEILLLIAEGLTNSDIAVKIGVSVATVKTHMDHVFAKTGTVHRAAAVAHALRHGWIR